MLLHIRLSGSFILALCLLYGLFVETTDVVSDGDKVKNDIIHISSIETTTQDSIVENGMALLYFFRDLQSKPLKNYKDAITKPIELLSNTNASVIPNDANFEYTNVGVFSNNRLEKETSAMTGTNVSFNTSTIDPSGSQYNISDPSIKAGVKSIFRFFKRRKPPRIESDFHSPNRQPQETYSRKKLYRKVANYALTGADAVGSLLDGFFRGDEAENLGNYLEVDENGDSLEHFSFKIIFLNRLLVHHITKMAFFFKICIQQKTRFSISFNDAFNSIAFMPDDEILTDEADIENLAAFMDLTVAETRSLLLLKDKKDYIFKNIFLDTRVQDAFQRTGCDAKTSRIITAGIEHIESGVINNIQASGDPGYHSQLCPTSNFFIADIQCISSYLPNSPIDIANQFWLKMIFNEREFISIVQPQLLPFINLLFDTSFGEQGIITRNKQSTKAARDKINECKMSHPCCPRMLSSKYNITRQTLHNLKSQNGLQAAHQLFFDRIDCEKLNIFLNKLFSETQKLSMSNFTASEEFQVNPSPVKCLENQMLINKGVWQKRMLFAKQNDSYAQEPVKTKEYPNKKDWMVNYIRNYFFPKQITRKKSINEETRIKRDVQIKGNIKNSLEISENKNKNNSNQLGLTHKNFSTQTRKNINRFMPKIVVVDIIKFTKSFMKNYKAMMTTHPSNVTKKTKNVARILRGDLNITHQQFGNDDIDPKPWKIELYNGEKIDQYQKVLDENGEYGNHTTNKVYGTNEYNEANGNSQLDESPRKYNGDGQHEVYEVNNVSHSVTQDNPLRAFGGNAKLVMDENFSMNAAGVINAQSALNESSASNTDFGFDDKYHHTEDSGGDVHELRPWVYDFNENYETDANDAEDENYELNFRFGVNEEDLQNFEQPRQENVVKPTSSKKTFRFPTDYEKIYEINDNVSEMEKNDNLSQEHSTSGIHKSKKRQKGHKKTKPARKTHSNRNYDSKKKSTRKKPHHKIEVYSTDPIISDTQNQTTTIPQRSTIEEQAKITFIQDESETRKNERKPPSNVYEENEQSTLEPSVLSTNPNTDLSESEDEYEQVLQKTTNVNNNTFRKTETEEYTGSEDEENSDNFQTNVDDSQSYIKEKISIKSQVSTSVPDPPRVKVNDSSDKISTKTKNFVSSPYQDDITHGFFSEKNNCNTDETIIYVSKKKNESSEIFWRKILTPEGCRLFKLETKLAIENFPKSYILLSNPKNEKHLENESTLNINKEKPDSFVDNSNQFIQKPDSFVDNSNQFIQKPLPISSYKKAPFPVTYPKFFQPQTTNLYKLSSQENYSKSHFQMNPSSIFYNNSSFGVTNNLPDKIFYGKDMEGLKFNDSIFDKKNLQNVSNQGNRSITFHSYNDKYKKYYDTLESSKIMLKNLGVENNSTPRSHINSYFPKYYNMTEFHATSITNHSVSHNASTSVHSSSHYY